MPDLSYMRDVIAVFFGLRSQCSFARYSISSSLKLILKTSRRAFASVLRKKGKQQTQMFVMFLCISVAAV